ncbi:hypothetical protein PG995_000315 [Apiospora arundinis]
MFRTWTKVKWMLINLVAPEYALGKAFSDYFSVKRLENRFKTSSESDGVPWTATHTHFANMGGFAVKFSPVSNSTISQEDDHLTNGIDLQDWPGSDLDTSVSAPAWLEHSSSAPTHPEYSSHQSLDTPLNWKPERRHYAELKIVRTWLDNARIRRLLDPESSYLLCVPPSKRIGEIDWQVDPTNAELVDIAVQTVDMCHFQNKAEFARFADGYGDVWASNIGCLKGNLWILDANQLLMAREVGIIDKLPFLASDDLDDRNKQDLFLKLLALGQISWFIFEIGSRLYRHLHISLLEVMVLAFSLCTIITYVLLLDKPNNATYTITVPAARHPQTGPEMTRLGLAGPAMSAWGRTSLWIPNNAAHLDYPLDGSAATATLQYTAWASAASVFMFGSIHCIGWNFQFPTHFEKIMWHASSIITAVAIPTGIVFSSFMSLFGNSVGLSYLLFGVPFVAARIFILVEVVRSLAYLPPDVFVTTWASEIPHA